MSGSRPPGGAPASRWGGEALVLLLTAVALSAVATVPLVRNYFLHDDFLNFFRIRNDDLFHFLFRIHAGHALVVRNLIWWCLDGLFGLRAGVYHASAVLTHLGTVALWFVVVRRLTGSARAAFVAALLWGSAPVQEEAVGWYAVYGQLLATIILAWIVYQLARLGEGAPLGTATLVGWVVLAPVVVTSFGMGVGMEAALPVVAWLLVPPGRTRRRAVAVLATVAVSGVLLYRGLVLLHEHLFGADIRLAVMLTGPDAPFDMLRMIGAMLGHGIGALLGAAVASRLSGSHPLTLLAAAGLLVVFACAPGRARRLMLVGVVLACGCYAPVAAGRVMFWRSGIDYDAAARFQYAATLGLSLVVAVAAQQVARWTRASTAIRRATTVVTAATVLAGQVWWRPPSEHFAGARQEAEQVRGAIRAAIDAAPPGEDVYIDARKFASVGIVMRHALTEFPGWAGVFVIFYPANVVDGHRVRFVTTPEVVATFRQGRRTADLLVTERP